MKRRKGKDKVIRSTTFNLNVKSEIYSLISHNDTYTPHYVLIATYVTENLDR